MDPRVEDVIKRIRKEYHRDPSLNEMAHVVNLSPSRLRYLFKKETGVAPGQYLKTLRLEQSRELLETTFLSVKEIVRRVGANDQSHFVREFKKSYGLTPAQYRTSLDIKNYAVEIDRNLDGLHALVVDDDQDTREVICILLEKAGASVTMMDSSAKALAALERLKTHILIIDIGLPEEDGYTFLRKARTLLYERGEQIPAVALTAYSREEDQKRALSAGFEIHMTKPPRLAELLEVVARLTDRTEAKAKSNSGSHTTKTANKQ